MTNATPEEVLEVIAQTRQMLGTNMIAIMMIAKTIGVDPYRLMDDAAALAMDEQAFHEVFREFEQ